MFRIVLDGMSWFVWDGRAFFVMRGMRGQVGCFWYIGCFLFFGVLDWMIFVGFGWLLFSDFGLGLRLLSFVV